MTKWWVGCLIALALCITGLVLTWNPFWLIGAVLCIVCMFCVALVSTLGGLDE